MGYLGGRKLCTFLNAHTQKNAIYIFYIQILSVYYDVNLNLHSSLGLPAVRYLSNLIYRVIILNVKDKIHEISLIKMTCNKGEKTTTASSQHV